MKALKNIPMNVFTVLMVAASLSLLFRGINIVVSGDRDAPAIAAAVAQAQKTGEEPPPLSADDIKKAIADTAAAANDGQPPAAAEGPDSIQPPAAAPAGTAEKPDSSMPPKNALEEERVFSPSEIEVLQSLARRRDDLDKREEKIAAQEALLNAAEKEVDKKIAELNQLKSNIEKLLGQQEKMEEDRIASLVKIYEGMKPKEAATIFNTLDMDVLLAVIGRMSERKSSPVLAAMDPAKARIVTIRLAEQRKLPAPQKEQAPPPAPPAPAPDPFAPTTP